MKDLKIGIPRNVFSSIVMFALPEAMQQSVKGLQASVISKELEEGNIDIGLIPTCDLLTHNEFFVSSKAGIAFDGELSNSYLYYKSEEHDVNEILLRGDTTTNEIILSKLVFFEMMKQDVEVKIDTEQYRSDDNHYLISGMDNIASNQMLDGFSFSDHLAESLNAPYVNFVFASKSKELLEEFNKAYAGIEETIAANLDDYLKAFGLDEAAVMFIKENIDGAYFELTDIETDGLKEMLMMPYYKGMVEDIKEVNFV